MRKTKRMWGFEEISRNVHRLRFEFSNTRQVFPTLWISDLHWDNPKCDRTKLRRHLVQAMEMDAPIVVVGDLFCAMQGKFDKRSCKSDLRPEHQRGDYFDALVDTAREWFAEFKSNLVVLGQGNHESSVLGRHETDLLDRLAGGLRSDGGLTRPGGYNGWLQYSLKYAKTTSKSFNFFYAHGSGGGAPVTKGQINFNRWREQVTADAYIAGHIHRRNLNDQVCAEITNAGRPVLRQVDYVRLSTYKEEYGDGAFGWHNERQAGPRPIGGYWCEWRFSNEKRQKSFQRRWVATD